jgi:hypothetical protein
MTGIDRARLVTLQQTGSEATGYITIAEESSGLPFVPAAVEWLFNVPGNKAMPTEQPMLLVCLSGTAQIFLLSTTSATENHFTLTKPSQGLYLPAGSLFTCSATEEAIFLKLLA